MGFSPAYAAETLLFDSKIGPSSQIALSSYSLETAKSDLSRYDFAQADLNGDGINEFILRDKVCSKGQNVCDYNVWAETEKGVISLGSVPAKTILLGNEQTHGIRNLLAFDNASNDFDYTLYVWQPAKALYVKKDP
jgi:hypothetical protein